MASYLICYELVTNKDDSRLIAKLKSFGIWGRVIGNTWVIQSDKNFVELRDEISECIENNDRLLVVKTDNAAAWKNVICSNEWLKAHV
ncbi:TPA: hypothetical protein UO054_005294 [Klebsiella pneumoniae]|jgi:hypothetical protein|uniref:hypothetical protein n=1 Tax=Klebsiella pneumoniae complex TaxID=3390273 RepID=UPI00115754C7|nr:MULTISPECIES: hypothetical protein [Klebsiella]HCB1270242.1 hypothetical protein [Klebsiella quasipneumoniae subsp. quasipneumoniae]HCB1334003.1 hypothetical protein [Klebsiella variicola subsp. variicola]MEA5495557.1 hypothetical protein [Klebsiella variicola]HCB1233522.1 hypothetical protein [Klebsiella pneumoniae]HCM7351708.1 hypothetical protein [Klebsiella pneumoniae]